MNNNAILFECASKPPHEVDSIRCTLDAHQGAHVKAPKLPQLILVFLSPPLLLVAELSLALCLPAGLAIGRS